MSCKKNPATVKLTKLVKGTVEELWLCQQCAAEKSPYHKKISSLSIESILANILGQQQAEEEARPGESDLSCGNCGLPFESYRGSLLLGCSDCYASFEQQIVGDLRKFHGSTVHTGRTPSGVRAVYNDEAQRDPQDLRKRLQAAVESEDFELAAKLRDELRSLETRTKTN